MFLVPGTGIRRGLFSEGAHGEMHEHEDDHSSLVDERIQRFRDSRISDSGLVISDEGLKYRYGDSNPGLMAENHPS